MNLEIGGLWKIDGGKLTVEEWSMGWWKLFAANRLNIKHFGCAKTDKKMPLFLSNSMNTNGDQTNELKGLASMSMMVTSFVHSSNGEMQP